jgi:hypothetical protein
MFFPFILQYVLIPSLIIRVCFVYLKECTFLSTVKAGNNCYVVILVSVAANVYVLYKIVLQYSIAVMHSTYIPVTSTWVYMVLQVAVSGKPSPPM